MIFRERQERGERFKYSSYDFLMIVFSFLFGLCISLERLIARDEGFYTFASHLVRQGFIPYHDFFYPQMPLLPYIFGLGSFLTGADWIGFRVGSGIVFFGILSLTYLIIRLRHSSVWGTLGIVLLATCHLSFAWFSVVQTYGLSILFLLAVLLLLSFQHLSRGGVFLAGLFLGFSIATRLIFLPIAIVPLIFLLPRARREFLPSFLLGSFVGGLPILLHLFQDTTVFWFNNLGYHMDRSERLWSDEVKNKWRVFEVLFSLGRPSQKFSGVFQTPILFGGMFLAALLGSFRSKSIALSSSIGILLFAIHFTPSPTYVQYFATVVPFAVLSSVFLCAEVIAPLVEGYFKPLLTLVVFLLLVGYLRYLPQDLLRYTRTGEGVIGVGNIDEAQEWNIEGLQRVRSTILLSSSEDETILALWPGYLVDVSRKHLPGTENHFGLRAGEKLSQKDEERARYKVKSIADIISAIQAEEVALIVGHKRSYRGKIRQTLKQSRYEKLHFPGLVEYWRRRSDRKTS